MALGGRRLDRRPDGWGARLLWPEDLAQGPGRVLSQAAFERELLETDGGGPKLGDLRVHPPDADGRTWVVGVRYTAGQAEPFRFPAPAPYRPLHPAGPPAPDLAVDGYLRQVQEAHPTAALTWSRAWWAAGPGLLAVWAAGAVVIVGGIWPSVLNLLVGAGLGRSPPDPAYDLDRFKGDQPEGAISAGPPPAADVELEDFERRMLGVLTEAPAGYAGRASVVAPPAPAPAGPAPVRVEDAPPPPSPAPLPAAEPNVFEGEFYPVARPHRHDVPSHGRGRPRRPLERSRVSSERFFFF